MALKLLQPGLRPMGQFDLDDNATAANITGGELMTFAGAFAGTGAADIGNGTPSVEVGFCTTEATDATEATGTGDKQLGFLADEGIRGYGTLLGSAIGATAGLTTQSGAAGGAVVIGPRTGLASGKVTLHHAPGLYGFSAPVDGSTTTVGAASDCWKLSGTGPATTVNLGMSAATGKWNTATAKDQCHAIMVGAVTDSSLVSTSNSAAGEAAVNEYHAMYYLGALGDLIDLA